WRLYEKCASIPEIDYINMHIWPYNWEWIDRSDPAAGVTRDIERSIDSTNAYAANHEAIAEKVNKPLVCEEFGSPRDSFKFAASMSASARDSQAATSGAGAGSECLGTLTGNWATIISAIRHRSSKG
ncbi:MAG: hypothetical protein QMB59_06005, partial [Bacteroidales bacterium]